ncbi:MAG: transposase domain-containing protein [Lachnospiraceae bacterium]|nr:transposase domain-containing protein [Lachnospiraceae bacterium]
MLCSLAETAKANHLKPYEHFKWLFEQMLLHEGNMTEAVFF